jgi:hypothetical protein
MADIQEDDWEITPDGLYIATRGFLIRRGYCCANRCRNCPYINWQHSSTWQPIPAERVKRMHVSAKAVDGVSSMLHYHEQQLRTEPKRTYHQKMIAYYRTLLERWGNDNEEHGRR